MLKILQEVIFFPFLSSQFSRCKRVNKVSSILMSGFFLSGHIHLTVCEFNTQSTSCSWIEFLT